MNIPSSDSETFPQFHCRSDLREAIHPAVRPGSKTGVQHLCTDLNEPFLQGCQSRPKSNVRSALLDLHLRQAGWQGYIMVREGRKHR
jgi:hypothetical protein